MNAPIHLCLPMAAIALALLTPAQAARPLNTDDAGVLDRGACELEAARTREKAEGMRAAGTEVQLGCGIGAGTQVALGLARSRADGQRERGLALSAKTSLVATDAAAWALAGALDWATAPGEGRRHVASALSLVHTRALGTVATLHLNLGHTRDEQAGRAATAWGVALEHAGLGPVAPVAEVFGDDRQAPSWNLGLRWTVLPDRLVLDAAVGRQIISGRPRAMSLGATLSF
jgi:hypothetical protein